MSWIKRKKWAVIGTIIGLSGFCVMVTYDWKMAAGVYLCIWGNNIGKE